MKILIFSDLHLHNWTYGASYIEGWNSRLLDGKHVMSAIYRSAIKHECEKIVFCGDLFHTHGKIDAHVLTVAWQGFTDLNWNKKRDFIAVGNHDFATRNGKVHSIPWMEPVSGYVGRYGIHHYTEDKKELEQFLKKAPKDAVIFLHQGVRGVPVNGDFILPNETLEPEMIPDHVQHVFTGHYHTHQQINHNLTIVGAPMQHTWADEGDQRGWLIYDDETNTIERVYTNNLLDGTHIAPEFKSLNYTHPTAAPCGYSTGLAAQGNFLRIKNFEGERDEFRRSLLDAGARSVEFVFTDDKGPNTGFFTVDDLRIDPLITEYEKQKELDERGKEVGKQVRNGTYEIKVS